MNMLRKIFLVMICALVIYPVHAEFYAGYRNECWVDDKGSDEYWFCGYQAESCRSNGATKKNKKNWIYDGKGFVHAGRTFWCCGGTGEKEGKFVEGLTWIKSSATKTKSVGGGTCEYTERTTVCDTTEADDCTVPTKCPSGKILRNKECATLCSSGQGFQSATSNTCIACSGTDRGVDTNKICVVCTGGQKWNGTRCEAPKEETCTSGQGKDSNGKCVACSGEDKGVDDKGSCVVCAPGRIWDSGTKACKDKPQETPKEEPKQEEPAPEEAESSDESEPETPKCQSSEYLSPKSGKCVSKSASKQYSRDMFDSCYACPTDTRFKRCLDFFRNPPTTLKESDKKVLVSCNIDPSEYDSDAAGKSKFRLIDKLGKLGGKGKTGSVPTKGNPGNLLQESAYRDNVATAGDYEF